MSLQPQTKNVFDFMSDGGWHSLTEISEKTGYPMQSVSARVRDLRKLRFGGHRIERRPAGNGPFEYRLNREGGSQEVSIAPEPRKSVKQAVREALDQPKKRKIRNPSRLWLEAEKRRMVTFLSGLHGSMRGYRDLNVAWVLAAFTAEERREWGSLVETQVLPALRDLSFKLRNFS